MNISTILKDIADSITTIPELRSIPALVVLEGDILNKLQASIAKLNFGVLVTFNGFTPQIVGATPPGNKPFGTFELIVQLYEKPVINRSRGATASPGAPTLLPAALAVAAALDGASGDNYPDKLKLSKISKISEIEGGIITCDVSFFIKAPIN